MGTLTWDDGPAFGGTDNPSLTEKVGRVAKKGLEAVRKGAEAVDRFGGSPNPDFKVMGGPVSGKLADLVPGSLTQAGADAAIGLVAPVPGAKGVAARLAAGTAGGAAGSELEGRGAASGAVTGLGGAAVGETLGAATKGLVNWAQTVQKFKTGEMTLDEFTRQLARDMNVPPRRMLGEGGKGEMLADSRKRGGGQIMKVASEVLEAAEARLRNAVGGSGALLDIPSLAKPTTVPLANYPGHTGRGEPQMPTFDEAIKALKQLKSDTRIIREAAIKKGEPLQAQEAESRLQQLTDQFNAAVSRRAVSSPDAIAGHEKAMKQYMQAVTVVNFLKQNPQIFVPGGTTKGTTIDQNKFSEAIMLSPGFTKELFPNAIKAAGRGTPYAGDQPVKLPGLSIGGGGAREFIGGTQVGTRKAGTRPPQSMAPALLDMGAITGLDQIDR